jgi:hypothetical protein
MNGQQMSSEWMKVMLEEISRKDAEAKQWRIEEQRRIEERCRREEGSCDTVREEHHE